MDEGTWEDIWPEPPQAGYRLPPLPGRDAGAANPDWANAPTDPYLPALSRVARELSPVGVRPEWPLPPRRPRLTPPPERFLASLEQRRLSLGCGLLAAVLLLSAGLLAAVTGGFVPFGPFGNGGVVPTHGVEANPLPSATPSPTATATQPPTPTATPLPTSTPLPLPTTTAAPTATPAITPTPLPLQSPIPTPTPTPSPSPSPSLAQPPAPTPLPTPTSAEEQTSPVTPATP